MEIVIGLVSFLAGGIVATLFHSRIALAEAQAAAKYHQIASAVATAPSSAPTAPPPASPPAPGA